MVLLEALDLQEILGIIAADSPTLLSLALLKRAANSGSILKQQGAIPPECQIIIAFLQQQ